MAGRSLKYLTLGLRRDRNLSDVQDPTQALNSLLDNLFSTNEPGTSFVSEDLDAIRGLQNSNVNASILSALSDTTVNVSKISTDINGNVVIVEEEVTPRVRLKDRIENSYLITSENPAIQGGNGLNCRFIESQDINLGTRTSTGATIFDFNSDQIQEIFWATGFFNFSSTIDPTFRDQYGGLQWTGWFTPSLRDPNVNIIVYTTGLFIFEVDLREDGNWQTLASIYNDVRQVQVATSATNTTTVTLSPGEGKYVGEGDYWGTYSEAGPNIVILTVDGDVLTLDTPVDVVATQNYNVSKVLGETRTVSDIPLPSIAVGDFLKVRISVWWPDNGEPVNDKNIEFEYIGTNLNFFNMYDEKPNPVPEPLEIRTFLNDIVTPFQNFIGLPTQNRNFYVNNSATINYTPVSGWSQVLKHGPVNLTFTDYNSVIRFASSVPNAVIGDVIIPTTSSTFINSLPNKNLLIKDDISNSVRIANQPPGVNQTIPVYVVDNKGFVDWLYGTVSGNNVTITVGNANLLRKDYIVMTVGTPNNSWIRITNVNKILNTFTTSASLGSGNILILVYSDKSLIDASKDIVCEGVIGQELQTTVSSGNVLVLKNATGVVAGQVVQFTGTNPSNPSIPNGTVVSSVLGNSVTLSNSITGQIRQDSTIVFAPPGTTVNVEGCIIPLNTAPPFIGTPAGLSTGSLGIRTVASNPTFAVKVNDLRLDTDTGNIVSISGTNAFNRKLQINLNNGLYSILARNV